MFDGPYFATALSPGLCCSIIQLIPLTTSMAEPSPLELRHYVFVYDVGRQKLDRFRLRVSVLRLLTLTDTTVTFLETPKRVPPTRPATNVPWPKNSKAIIIHEYLGWFNSVYIVPFSSESDDPSRKFAPRIARPRMSIWSISMPLNNQHIQVKRMRGGGMQTTVLGTYVSMI
jgi:hypothetical protein